VQADVSVSLSYLGGWRGDAGVAEDAFVALEECWRVLGEAERQLLKKHRDQSWLTGHAAEVARAVEGIKNQLQFARHGEAIARVRIYVEKPR
jgi:hypothetical protein